MGGDSTLAGRLVAINAWETDWEALSHIWVNDVTGEGLTRIADWIEYAPPWRRLTVEEFKSRWFAARSSP